MGPEQWNQVVELFHSARDKTGEERVALLESACAGNPALRQCVEQMLRDDEASDNFLNDSPASEWAAISLNITPSLRPKFGRYELVGPLGRGGMGEVWEARDTELDRRVALKFLSAAAALGQAAERLTREARAASALNHPNIVTVHEIFHDEQTPVLAMELVEGITLRPLVKTPQPINRVIALGRQIAQALAAAHERGIVHRDIKPENLMVRADGYIKVLDFGLARQATPGGEGHLSAASGDSALAGTLNYMAPEQTRGDFATSASDVFSLGIVLYELATGRHPFRSDSLIDTAHAIAYAEPTPPRALNHNIPQSLSTVLLAMLAKNPSERPSSAETGQMLAGMEAAEEATSTESRNSETLRLLARLGTRGRRPAKNAGLRLRQAMPIAALALISLLGLLWFLWTARKSPEPTEPMTVVPLTSFEGYKDFGSFSPDGKSIVFSWNGGQGGFGGKQERNIYIKKIGAGGPVRLTFAREDEILPAWSPDGRYIAFCRMIDSRAPYERFVVYIVPAAGGAPRKITEASEGVSWSPDGKALAVAGLPPESGGIFLVSLTTGNQSRLTGSRQYLDRFPMFSPDGRWIAFTRSLRPEESELLVVPTRGGTVRQLTFDHRPIYGEAWSGDSKEIVFASNRGSGGESLWRIPVGGGVPRRVSATLWGAFYPAISRQGDRLLYTESYEDSNIYASNEAGFRGRSAPARFSTPKLLIASSRRDDSPNISPVDGRIVFISKRTGNEEIWVCDRNGGDLRQLTSFGGPATGTPRWSPDGRWIAFDSLAAGNADIYVISAQGGAPRRLTSGPFGNFVPSWSPDSKRIYFTSDHSGIDQNWWIPAGGGSATQLTHGGAFEAFASPDGKLVYFTKRGWGPIWSVPADGGPEKPVPELARFDRIFRSWGLLRRGIYFISKEPGPRQTVRFFSFATRKVTPLLAVEGEPIWEYPDVALSPDGRTLLVARLDQEINDLMLIKNFR